MYKAKKRSWITTAIIAVVVIAMLLCCLGAISNTSKKAEAIVAGSIASQSTNLGEMLLEGYADNAGGNVFDGEVFWELVKQVTGVENPDKNTLTSSLGTKTSANFRTQNSGKDVVVTIGGKQWTATYLSQNSSGDPILTLWLANSATTATWSVGSNNYKNYFANQYTSNLYGTSYIRTTALNNGGVMANSNTSTSSNIAGTTTNVPQSTTHEWAKYTVPSVKGSLTEFIEVPNNISWQTNQQIAKDQITWPNANYNHNNNNDSLNYGGDGTTGDYLAKGVSKEYYSAWGSDYIWLPSIAETGANGEEGIWKASVNQRANSTYSWLRSAFYNVFYSSYRLAAAGTSMGNFIVYNAYAVRPAFHLNLKSAGARAGSLGAVPPSDVESVYNGNEQTLADISADQKGWFDSTKIDISYPEGGMKDAGTYQVTATIKSALADDGLIFKGDPDTSKGETATKRFFNFKITKKKIGVDIAESPGGGGLAVTPKSGAVYATDTGDRAPAFAIEYKNNSSGTTSNDYPTAVGTYTATVSISNDCNYELDGTYSKTITITAKSVTKPSLATTSLAYNGGMQEFAVSGVSDDVKIEPTTTGLTYADGKLSAKNAGTYKAAVSLADGGSATVWASGGKDSFELSVTITPKALTITISCDAVGNSWNYGDQPTVTITEDSFADDTVELKVYYINNTVGSGTKYDEINNLKQVNGKTTTITMPGNIAKGDYTIYVEKATAGSGNSNSNYSLNAPKTLVFNVKGVGITLQDTDINWMCNSISIGYPTDYSVTYTGSAFTFSIDDSVLAGHGVKIDTNKSGTTNGYSGNISATNASTSQYSVTVHLTNLDSTYETYTKQYTLSYRINKAKYDLSGLTWPSVNEFEYTGSAQGVELQGALPAGLTPTYTGDRSKTPVGEYTTGVTFSITPAYADNYIVPVAGDTDTYVGDDFKFSFDWKIIKATINVSWKNDNDGDVSQYTWPVLNNLPQANMVDYTYYKGDEPVTELPKPEDVTVETEYKVVATLKTAYKNNYQLSTGETAEFKFYIGKDRFPVKLTLQYNGEDIDGKQLPYKGSAYSPVIEILMSDGGVGAQDITLVYYKDGATNPIAGEPVEVGKYKIEVVLSADKAEDNYIDSANAEFALEIVKADFDVSGLKWQYTHGDVSATYDFDTNKWLDAEGNEIDKIMYDKSAHALTLVGKDGIDNLSISVLGAEATDAGSYTAEITFSYDAKNYNAPDFPTSLAWSIAKASIDTSAIVWGYAIGEGEEKEYTGPLPYARENGQEASYTVGLVNVPDILKDYISYTGVRTQSKKGDYSVQYALADLGNNYESVVMPSALQAKLNWSISVKILPTPVFDKSWTVFDGETHDFAKMFGITEEGWENYMTITITKDGVDYEGIDGDAYKAVKAGEYTVVFDLVDYDNIDWQDGVWPSASTLVRVKAYEINLEWQGNNTNATAVLEDWVKSYVDYRYKNSEGNILENGIRDMEVGITYFKELFAKEGYETDIKIYGAPKTVLRPGSSASIVKPVFDTDKKIVYNGNPHSIEEFLRDGEAPAGVKFEILDGNLTDAGDYTVKVSLEDDEIFCWDDEEGTTDSFTVTVTIQKATITQNKLNWTTGEDGLPKLTVRGNSEIEFSYTYYDEDGYELTPAEIADGVEWSKVVAKLDNNNYAMVDASNSVVDEVTYSPNDSNNPPSGNPSGENPSGNDGNGIFGGSLDEIIAKLKELPLWQLIASAVSIICIIVFLSKTAKYDSERKKYAKKTNKLENMYATAFLGVAMSIWTAIACVLIGVAVVTFVMMLIAKSRRNKAEEEYEDHLEEYNRNKTDFDEKKRDENLRMMLMGMMGGNAGGAQGGFAYAPGLGADDIRGIVSETMTAMLPGMQQLLPQQASANDEVVQKLIEQNEKLMQQLAEKPADNQIAENNNELVQKLMEQNAQNEERLRELNEQSEKRVEKLMQQLVEMPAEREAASASISEETLDRLVNKLQPVSSNISDETILKVMAQSGQNDETIKQMMKNQELLMQKILELSSQTPQPQVVEKVVEKEVPVEKVVEKIVEVPVEKIVEKQVKVEVPVEKVVEKQVVKEVKIASAPKQKKETAPRLTLDEAYDALPKQQKKYFDGLREYALAKDKCKEKKSTYFVVFGLNTANPLVKLTIKKDTVVALYKMEDEYMKDIRRNATSDGSKIKVKETELIVADAQAFKTAKDMIDLREDQIERYADYLKEQKALNRR